MDRTVTPQGRRASTARGYLDQAKERPNLTIHTHAVTDRVLVEGKRAVGVRYLRGREQPQEARARRALLLCGGDRKSGGQGRSVSVRGDLGGGRVIVKQKY